MYGSAPKIRADSVTASSNGKCWNACRVLWWTKTPIGPCTGSKCAAWSSARRSRACRNSKEPVKLPPLRELCSPTPASRTSRRWPLAWRGSFSNLGGFIYGFKCREHFAHMSVKISTHDVENFKNKRIAHGIKNLISQLAVHENVLRPQYRQVLGRICLLDAEPLNDSAGRQLAVSQLFHNRDPSGVSQSLEKISFELSERVLHFRNCIF